MSPLFSILWTFVLLILIVVVCELFTNAIEWVGHRFKLSDGAVGSVLAAVGTALPETMVPIVAIVSGVLGMGGLTHESGHDIGIGAILGAPFLLGTLAMFVSGAAALIFYKTKVRSTIRLSLDKHLSRRDMHYFFVAFGLAIGASFLDYYPFKVMVAVILLLIYAVYVWKTLAIEHVPDEEFSLPPLTMSTNPTEPPTWVILAQVTIALLGILILAHLFVDQVHILSDYFHIPSLILSLVITPIATELPEKFNSVMWIRKGKDNLALGNITGAMVFQSCIPVSVGLLFTPWHLTNQALMSTGLCILSALTVYILAFQRWHFAAWGLLAGGLYYLLFLLYILPQLH